MFIIYLVNSSHNLRYLHLLMRLGTILEAFMMEKIQRHMLAVIRKVETTALWVMVCN